jgi:hypothetical protein
LLLHRIAVHAIVDYLPEITVLQLPKFKSEATALIGADAIQDVGFYLAQHSG